jgi:dihydroflavonol-4-reductase
MSTVLVTGGTGFVGSNLVPHLLRDGAHVRTLVRDTGTGLLDPSTVEMIIGDVRDPDAVARAMKGVDTVYHVAGLVSYWRPRRRQLHEVNVTGTRNVVSACLAEGVRRLVFTSSVGAIGVPAEGTPGDEATPYNWDPGGYYYCLTKYMAEGEICRGVAAGLSAVILNPALVAGPRDVNWNAGRIFAMVNRGNRVICTNGTVSLVDVDDVCRAHVAAASTGRSGARYILAGHGIAYRDLFAEVASVMGRPGVKVKVVSDRTALLAARVKTTAAAVTKREPDITPELVRMNVRWRVFDSSAAKRDLGFTVTPLRETLQRTYDWYRAKNLLLPDDGQTHDGHAAHALLSHSGRAAALRAGGRLPGDQSAGPEPAGPQAGRGIQRGAC